jgi:hypothetical protein
MVAHKGNGSYEDGGETGNMLKSLLENSGGLR